MNIFFFFRKLLPIMVLVLFISHFSIAQQTSTPANQSQKATLSGQIRLNQIGFYPSGPKVAVVAAEAGNTFYITTIDLRKTVFTGKLTEPRTSEFSAKKTRIADFSALTTPGSYVVYIPEIGHSYPFEIKSKVHQEVAKASIKGFYFQRISTPLPEQYAGKWQRPAGHVQEDTQVLIHPSAATTQRPEGTKISAPLGWYDAGDYNKYIVNSGITTGTLLSLYEDFPTYFDTLKLNIPESNNNLPDLLDETLWNLRWMLAMQDPNDGGVYHKLTNPRFDGMVMPEEAKNPRYVVQKSTPAALDFAAVMAQASRIARKFPQALPGLADSCLTAATRAWDWARQNPAVLYDQEALNKQYDPDVSTGAYGDKDVTDEFIWAASELYITTKKDSYYQAVPIFPDTQMPLPSWAQVRLLGYYTLARFEKDLTPVAKKDFPQLRKQLVQFADELTDGASKRSYATVMGKSAKDYIWGSSAVAANQGIALIQVYRLTGDKKYLDYALINLDYLVGRNATGFSFVTGFGDKTPMHPHHRPSIADQVEEPVPGLLSGGPNANAPRQDKCTTYTSTIADETFTDDDCSYASNEIAINWNAPLAYLASAIEALQSKAGYSSGKEKP
ncbi:glycoside hydrolase family 9 protein [Rhodocytophaga aerolata]|uniref:Endoglucanase n=1 Tax=Rhodocytophaga aerolata TaxID=455078 RepID=A0ABT8R7B5_9BACT|nr:glycoside hydrolase family 9 protein [Rhodocytophaga aerolata]MDO1447073.1 glycoside hydrolase family 9 protein [Rhodocytophaga aerolata]